MKRIPLRNRQKEVVAYALVDDDLHAWLSQWRWSCSSEGYVVRSVHWRDAKGEKVSRLISMHRQVAGLEYGDPRQVDHWDGCTLNNQRRNLRLASPVLNGQNRKLNKNSTTGYRGVSYERGRDRFLAYTNVNKVRHRLGYFDTAEEAAATVQRFRQEHLPYSPEASIGP